MWLQIEENLLTQKIQTLTRFPDVVTNMLCTNVLISGKITLFIYLFFQIAFYAFTALHSHSMFIPRWFESFFFFYIFVMIIAKDFVR